MAYSKAQLEAFSAQLLASSQPIAAVQHRAQVQTLIDELFSAQGRGNVLSGVQTTGSAVANDSALIFRSGQAFRLPLSAFAASNLSSLGDVSISTPQANEVLLYDDNIDRWVNGNLSGVFGGTSNEFVKGDGSLDGTAYEEQANKGQANGYAQLDSGAKLPTSIIPDSVLGQVEYQGTWNADTNTPTLPTTPDKKGDYYVVSEAGTFVGIDFEVGDWIISNGTAWEKVNNTDAVRTVFGRLGDIVANSGDYDAFYPTLTGDNTFSGINTFNQSRLRLAAAGSAQTTILTNVDGITVSGPGINQFGFNSSNNIYVNKGTGNGFVLAFNNTVINRIYTLQNASGTIAFTSDITNALGDYVTLNTDQTITGIKNFNQNRLRLAAEGSSQASILTNSSGDSSSTGGNNTFGFNVSNNIFANKGSGNGFILAFNNTVINRTYTLQDASGTLAFTSDIKWRISVDGTGGTETIGSDDLVTFGSDFGAIDITRVGKNVTFNPNFGTVANTIAQGNDPRIVNAVQGSGVAGRVAFWDGTNSISSDSGFIFSNSLLENRITVNLGGNSNAIFLRQGINAQNPIIGTSTRIVISSTSTEARAAGIQARHFEGVNGHSLDLLSNSSGGEPTIRWSILPAGVLQSSGAQTIQTSTGALTLATGAGNGNIILSPHGSGRVLIGNTAQRNTYFNTNITSNIFQLEKANDSVAASFFANGNAAGNSAALLLGRSRGTTLNSNTIVQNGDVLGLIMFNGSDGTRPVTGAMIESIVDGTPADLSMPARLVFRTTPAGSSSATERLRITSGGNVGIGTTSPGSKLSIVGLPTSPSGLSSGDIWNDGGTLKIV